MDSALHIKTTVLPGCRIEVASPELKEGAPVDVFLVMPESGAASRGSALEIIRRLKGHRLFHSPEEVDRHLKEERDAWDR
jgi:hypothetical protein